MERIQYASDLHLEFDANSNFINQHPLVKTAEILVLAGDITVFDLYNKTDFFKWCSKTYRQTYIVPGNHEYYKGRYVDETYTLTEDLYPNVTIVNNTSVVINNTQIFFTTLWSDLDIENELSIRMKLNDFKKIKWFKNGNKTRSDKNENDENQDNEKVEYRTAFSVCKKWLENELGKSTSQFKVVVTHHCPIMDLTLFQKTYLTTCFNVDMKFLMEKYQIHYWIYGHTHSNFKDFEYHGCIVTSNQLGYISYKEGDTFSATKFVPKPQKELTCCLC
ncbi:hypothetical protein EIN_337890 [Entamoeba invadens IP1]|uniref:Calcineurin-like phosphoesterase domain-containing protein n=1 Tax=Entamoeba invadens IP1 TaxID=370355 RepID=A0A0A1TXD9_ENTIV|nr:hypothetical protein EIN_337890 [Entamoeba invadens IP1]ELP84170.1 hypothetical protein EIN_337890 [Entamoeba invadens IP1]|eukprot:XP_004183516.1 hypothetical protein EIN_337890 [Entamoeba invadens IP1]